MKREITDLIDRVKADCLVGKPQKRDTIIALLDLEPGSQEYAYLCRQPAKQPWSSRERKLTFGAPSAWILHLVL